jgi:hypothetical protein
MGTESPFNEATAVVVWLRLGIGAIGIAELLTGLVQ